MNYRIGQVIDGVISGIQDYGVFVALDDKTQGLVHISECKDKKIEDVHEEFEVGQRCQVVVLDIDDYSGAISLSLRQMEILKVPAVTGEEKPQYRGHKHFWTRNKLEIGFDTIDTNMDQMKKEALSRIN
jgi:general stress protein 13